MYEQHEIEFNPEDIIAILKSCWSDDMAKVISKIGEIFNKDQMAECMGADDLNEHGKEFVENMYYFLHGED